MMREWVSQHKLLMKHPQIELLISKGLHASSFLMSPYFAQESKARAQTAGCPEPSNRNNLSLAPDRCSVERREEVDVGTSLCWVFIYVCSSGWPQTFYVAKDDFELLIFLPPVLEWQICTTMSSLWDAGIEPRDSCLLGKLSMNGMFSALGIRS